MYDKLVEKVNNIDTTGFFLKTTYDTDKSDLEKKINYADKKFPDTSDRAKKADLNAKTTEIENKISSITNLATNSALTAVENKIPDVISLVTKTDYNTKISDIEKKITDHDHDITTSEFNKLITEKFKTRLAQTNLVTKTDFDTKLKYFNKKINSNKTNHLLVVNELKKLKTFDLSYFRGKNYFGDDPINYLVFEPIPRYFDLDDDNSNDAILSRKSKGLFNEIIKSPRSNNDILPPILKYIFTNPPNVEFNGSCLIQDMITYTPKTIVNIYIIHEITKYNPISSYPTHEIVFLVLLN